MDGTYVYFYNSYHPYCLIIGFYICILLKFIPSTPPYNWMVQTYTSKIHTTHTAYNWMVHTYTVYTIHTTLCGCIFQWTRNMLCNICSGWQTCLHLASTLQWIASAFSNKLIRFIWLSEEAQTSSSSYNLVPAEDIFQGDNVLKLLTWQQLR